MKIVSMFFLMAIAIVTLGCNKGIPVKCEDKLKDVKVERQDVGSSFAIICPSGCATGTVWGADVYTIDSSFCRAAIHAGVIKAASGGNVKVTLVKSLPSYKGSDRNGIQTSDWASSWGDKAFTVSK